MEDNNIDKGFEGDLWQAIGNMFSKIRWNICGRHRTHSLRKLKKWKQQITKTIPDHSKNTNCENKNNTRT